MPNIAVWVEVNSLRANIVADAIAGIEKWGKHMAVKAMIVSTVPGNEMLFMSLLPVCEEAGLTLLPGIKTYGVLSPDGKAESVRQFDDIHGWSAIADSVRLVADHAQSPIVLLENETAIKGYADGSIAVSPAQLGRALAQLPQGITILWYPGITSGYHNRQLREAAALRILKAEHPRVVFADRSIDRPTSAIGAWAKQNHASLRALGGFPLYRLLYCYGPDHTEFWQDEAIVPLIVGEVAAPDWAVLYPGAARFAEAAESIGPLLDIAFGEVPETELETIEH